MIKKLLYLFLWVTLPMSIRAKDQYFCYYEANCITYQVIGEGKTDLLFIHGFGSSKKSWEDITPKIDTTKYKLFLLDLKGFGNSDIPKDGKYGVKDQADIIQLFVQEKIDSNFVLIGHSYGGGIALYLTSQKMIHPQKLILLDCAAYNYDDPFFMVGLRHSPINRLAYWFTTPRLMARIGLNYIVYKDNFSKKLIDRYAKIIKGKDKPYSHINTARQIIPENYDSLIASYSNITIPTLIIWGANDKVLSPKQGEDLHKQIKSSELHVLDKCGHIPHEELPELTFPIIQGFLEK